MKMLHPIAALFLFATVVAAEERAPALNRFSIENMDRSADPGRDFYRFANGHWLDTQQMPPDQVTWSPTTQLIERNRFLLRDILESCSNEHGDRDRVSRQVGDFYAAAMDTERLEALGFKPIERDLAAIGALKSTRELALLLPDLHERGIQPLFSVWVSPDERKSSIYALQLGQGGLGLPDREYYFAEQFARERAAYAAHIARMLKLFGEPDAQIERDVKAIIGIETALAKASKRLEELEDPIANYHKLTLAELTRLTPSFDWPRYFKASHAAETNYVLVGQPAFFKEVEAQLKSRLLVDWQSYLRWHVFIEAAPLLHSQAESESFAFYGTILRGQPNLGPRWKRATRRVDSALGEALGKLYVERHFPPAARARMNDLVENVKGVYRDRLGRVPWMTQTTREKAVEKFHRFGAKIGAPEKFRDYSAVEVRRDDYLGNVQRAAAFESRRQMARVGQPVDRTEWGMTPPTVNAYFNATINEIVFPAGILQPPFFDPEMDDAVNYGATATTIGHEMTHGYDSEGRKYDGQGNLKDWWTKADAKQFETRAQKLVQQFNAYEPLAGVHVNGKLTLAENIADLGGVSIAFEALQRALAADPSKRKAIDGFTPEQRFFISYAQSWAGKYRDEYLRQSLTTDTHAPDMLRGFAPLLNVQEFYDAFSIDPGAPVYRPKEKRAIIW